MAKETGYLEGSNGVFLQTDTFPDMISRTRPLLDRSNTPRKAFREISLNRNFTNRRWLYNKARCEEFDMRLTKVELKRGKELRKITRREDKEKLRRSKRSVDC